MAQKKSTDVRVSLYVKKERMDDIRRAMKSRGFRNKSAFFIDAAHERALTIITENARRKSLENSVAI